MSIGLLVYLTVQVLGQDAVSQPKPQPTDPRGGLFIIRSTVNGKAGFVDLTGHIVIKPQFDDAGPFSEGLAAVSINKKWGFINSTGRVIIEPTFEFASAFSEELAPVAAGPELRWGFINKSGALVIRPRFDNAAPFHEGLAYVEVRGRTSYIDKTGKAVIENPRFERASSFKDGMAFVQIENSKGLSYIDKTGRIVIEPLSTYEEPHLFSEGLVPAIIGERREFGYVNKKGETVIRPQFKEAGDFSDGLAAVQIQEGTFGYIDKAGKFVIPPRFDGAKKFSEGFAPVAIGSMWGFISINGRLVIEPQFTNALPFAVGLAVVGVGLEDGYMNKSGKVVVRGDILPLKSRGALEPLSDLRLDSQPAGARIFLIGLRDWEDYDDGARIINDDTQMSLYEVLQGNTPITTKARNKVYMAVFKLNKRIEVRKVDVNVYNNNEVHVNFK
jgi:hypothetical protein